MIVGRILRQILPKPTYHQAVGVYSALLWRWRLTRQYREEVRRCVESGSPPVFVYQMAKVGSSTVTWALHEIDGLHVFQVHLLHPDNLHHLRAALRKRGRWLARLQSDMDVRGRVLYKRLIKPGMKAKIITLVREPVGRNCSFYFQNLDVLWGTANAHEKVEMSRLVGEYMKRFDHRRGLDWFDDEFKPVLGVDVYEHPFPHDAGHMRIDAGHYEILVMRSDLEDSLKKECIEKFLGIEGLSLAPKNVGSQKPYAAAYRKFLDALELPESYVKEMLDSKYARHFFGPKELSDIRAKWLREGTD